MKHYWYSTCRNCRHQGRLMVMKNLSARRLYLHCEECESGWYDPLQIDNLAAKFLTLDEEFEGEAATWEDIQKAGWQPYAVNVCEE